MNIRKNQIKDLFNYFYDTIKSGIWFIGIRGEGLCIHYYSNGNISYLATVDKNNPNKLVGDYKFFDDTGKLFLHLYFHNNEVDKIYIGHGFDFKDLTFIHPLLGLIKISEYKKKLIKKVYNNEKYKKKTN